MNKSNYTKESFTELYEKYYEQVLRICRAYVNGDVESAKDLTQDVFSRVWENLESFNENSKISTWIYRIAVNTCLLYKRKSKPDVRSYKVFTKDEGRGHELYELRMKKMFEAINKLPDRNKSIILLELESVPQKEIAEIMGMTHSAVSCLLYTSPSPRDQRGSRMPSSA